MKVSPLEQLIELETELHRIETRRNTTRLDQLLHHDFVEFGRSGRRYSRREVLQEFAGDDMPPVRARDFECAELGPGVALLTYRSAHVGPAGELFRETLRVSVWVETATGWRMRFHQGTPVDGSPLIRM
jgi:hypothetical protein